MRTSLLACQLAVAALVALAAAPAAAQVPVNDARCFIVSNMFATSGDAKGRRAAAQASYYYLGRLNGSIAQIEAAIAVQGKTVTPGNAAATMQACAQVVAKRARDIQAVGRRLNQGQR